MIFTGTLISRLKNSIRILNLERIDNHCTLIKLKLRAKAVPDILRRIKNHADFIAALEKNDFDPVLAECCLLPFDYDRGSQMNIFACSNSAIIGKLLKVVARSGVGGDP